MTQSDPTAQPGAATRATLWHLVLSEALSFDEGFAATARSGPPAESLTALTRWWNTHQSAKLLESASLPTQWQQIGDELGRLSTNGPAGGGLQEWRLVCGGAQQLANGDAIAGCLLALQALAAWEGAVGAQLYQMPLGVPPNPGWEVFPLALCHCLRSAGAVWSALLLARTARDTIGFASYAYHDHRIREMIARYRELIEQIELELAQAERTLAWELREACGPAQPSLQPEVSALLWTLGDVSHAAALQHGAIPALRVLEDLVHTSTLRIRSDPLLQYVWLELKDRPPLDLRAHRLLFARINAFYTDSPLHRLEAMFGAGASASRAYARALVAHFDGGVSQVHLADLGLGQTMIEQIDPGSSVSARWHALFALLGPVEDAEDGGAAQRQQRWQQQTKLATASARGEHRDAQVDSYDRALDIPFQQLALESLPDRVAAIDALERYRAACLWYPLTRVRPLRLPTGVLVDQWLEREAGLLDELPGLRFVRLLSRLPRGFSRIGMDMRALSEREEDSYSLLNPDRAVERLAQIDAELRLVNQGLLDEAPDYARRRADPAVTLKELRRFLSL